MVGQKLEKQDKQQLVQNNELVFLCKEIIKNLIIDYFKWYNYFRRWKYEKKKIKKSFYFYNYDNNINYNFYNNRNTNF